MAAFMTPTTENCKSLFERNSIENEEVVHYDSINETDKKESCNERSSFYKKPIKKNNLKLEADFNDTPQEIRRQRILYYQKQNRNASFNAGRGLLEDVFNCENGEKMEEEVEKDDELEGMEIDHVKKKRYVVIKKNYARMLMLSEWMLEIPQDFADKWIMVPCPEGKRVLLVAHKGCTKLYTRRGIQICTFKTVLPGGSPKTCKNSCTILDCIWLKDKETCYVLDVLAWSNQEMLNCDVEFRFYWLKSQLTDLPELKEQINGVNEYPILSLPNVPCDQDFYEHLQNISTFLPLDGLLFYHKEGHYTDGKTPLVTWLKTYMLPEILGMNVPEPYDKKPNSYIDFEHHVLKVIQIKKKIENMQKSKEEFKNTAEKEEME